MIALRRADGPTVITLLRDRTSAFLKARYRRGAVGAYGAGLGCDCGDCPTGPHSLAIPMPRRDAGGDARVGPRSPAGAAHGY